MGKKKRSVEIGNRFLLFASAVTAPPYLAAIEMCEDTSVSGQVASQTSTLWCGVVCACVRACVRACMCVCVFVKCIPTLKVSQSVTEEVKVIDLE